MISNLVAPSATQDRGYSLVPRSLDSGRGVLLVEDEAPLRASMVLFLEGEGYDVSVAANGSDALKQLRSQHLPDIIILDLRMPVMDGWEFRTLQKDDPKLGRIPVIAISADGSAQAAAISANAYLRKPVQGAELLGTIKNVLSENDRKVAERVSETERLASLGRLAAGVGHEINNPLAFVMLNLCHSLEALRPWVPSPEVGSVGSPRIAQALIHATIAGVVEMLEDCVVGGERIRATVGNLQKLSRQGEAKRGERVDVHKIIEQSVAMVWNQIRHRARLIKTFGKVPMIEGDSAALGQVFLNLLVNAAQALPDGKANQNEIWISTTVAPGDNGSEEVVVEIRDSGRGMEPELLSHVFEPFFTTKALGQGMGLGLSISRQTIIDHGGRMTADSVPEKGSVFRTFLPIGASVPPPSSAIPLSDKFVGPRGRVLVIDDEPLIGRVVRRSLKADHEVVIVESATEAITRFERGEKFDLVLCDVVMPNVTGPDLHAIVADRWPHMLPRLIFMSGGAFTPATAAFLERLTSPVLYKPFRIDLLRRLIHEAARAPAA